MGGGTPGLFGELSGKSSRVVSMQPVCSKYRSLRFISESSFALPEMHPLGFSFGRKLLKLLILLLNRKPKVF